MSNTFITMLAAIGQCYHRQPPHSKLKTTPQHAATVINSSVSRTFALKTKMTDI